MFCECSANQLRQLQRTYCNFTESDGSEDSEHCYFMPKLEKLLSVFREFANSQHEGKEYSADCFIYETYFFNLLHGDQNRRLAKWIFLHFLSQVDPFMPKISPNLPKNFNPETLC